MKSAAVLVAAIFVGSCGFAAGGEPTIRAGHSATITAVRNGPPRPDSGTIAGVGHPYPQPRLAGFSPLVAITTSNKKRSTIDDSPYEHVVESTYAGQKINPFPEADYIIGYLDSGAVVDLTSDFYGFVLGLSGQYMTENTIPIGGVGGTVAGFISQPIGYFAAGLANINANGDLNFAALKGHSNASVVVGPDLDCGNGEELTAVVGTPLMAFFNSIIRVDTPRRVLYDDRYYSSPDVQIQSQTAELPEYSHLVSMELGGISPVTTSSFYPDFEDLETPLMPTQLTLTPVSFPTGGVFFRALQLRQGPSGLNNLPISARVMVDTGAQSSIISPGIAAELNLPIDPDFVVNVCGVGGLQENVPGYYVDYVRINALGGALEFSRAPFVVLDLQSPEGGPLDGILGMNFFWNRNIIFEPSLTGSSFLHVSDPVPFAAADFDLDLHVDFPDLQVLTSCSTGPAAPSTPDCSHTDMNHDGPTDLVDFAALQRCFAGSESPADVNCGH